VDRGPAAEVNGLDPSSRMSDDAFTLASDRITDDTGIYFLVVRCLPTLASRRSLNG